MQSWGVSRSVWLGRKLQLILISMDDALHVLLQQIAAMMTSSKICQCQARLALPHTATCKAPSTKMPRSYSIVLEHRAVKLQHMIRQAMLSSYHCFCLNLAAPGVMTSVLQAISQVTALHLRTSASFAAGKRGLASGQPEL